MSEDPSVLPGSLAAEGLAPDIADRITVALELVGRVRASLAEKFAAFADVPAALLPGLKQLGENGGLVPTALMFGLMLRVGLAVERMMGPRPTPPRKPHPDQNTRSRLVELLIAGAPAIAGPYSKDSDTAFHQRARTAQSSRQQ